MFTRKDYDVQRGSFTSIIYTIVQNRSIDLYRKLERRITVDMHEQADCLSYKETITDTSNLEYMLEAVFEQMNPEWVQIAKMLYVQKMTCQEIAAHFNTTAQAIRNRMCHGKKKFKTLFQQLFPDKIIETRDLSFSPV